MRTTINHQHGTTTDQPSSLRAATTTTDLRAITASTAGQFHRTAAYSAPENILAELRDVTPTRTLGLMEAFRVAELQANKLREHLGLDETLIPSEVIANQERVQVVFDALIDGKASGSSHWTGTHWIIVLNPMESPARQRFSLFHEYKHIIDDRFHTFLYLDEANMSAHRKGERVADYFAACALMPKVLVKRHFCSGVSNLRDLADLFDVSGRAIEIRLDQLGLRTAETNTYGGEGVTNCFNANRHGTAHAEVQAETATTVSMASHAAKRITINCTRGYRS
jgi:Zn-dependent peptidase ImmA (M78 family)